MASHCRGGKWMWLFGDEQVSHLWKANLHLRIPSENLHFVFTIWYTWGPCQGHLDNIFYCSSCLNDVETGASNVLSCLHLNLTPFEVDSWDEWLWVVGKIDTIDVPLHNKCSSFLLFCPLPCICRLIATSGRFSPIHSTVRQH